VIVRDKTSVTSTILEAIDDLSVEDTNKIPPYIQKKLAECEEELEKERFEQYHQELNERICCDMLSHFDKWRDCIKIWNATIPTMVIIGTHSTPTSLSMAGKRFTSAFATMMPEPPWDAASIAFSSRSPTSGSESGTLRDQRESGDTG
jgi:hypothetical protein